MNFYTSAIVSTNVIGAWETYLLWRQRRNVALASRPAVLKDSISDEDFAKAQSYGKEKTGFAIFNQLYDVVKSNIYLFGAAPARLYRAVASVTGFSLGSFSHCFAYSVAGDLIGTLLDIPLSYYKYFVLEERHGFNKMTRKDFALDTVKMFALRVVLLHPIKTGLIQWVVRRFGEAFPLYLFAATATVFVAFTFIFPTVIQPMFNTFSELDEGGELYMKIRALANRVHFPIKKVYIMDGSRRSGHGNAYFYGFFGNVRIVLFDTLIEQMGDDSERIMAVLSHELGHWKLSHTYYNLGVILGLLLALSLGARTVIFNRELYSQFSFESMDPVIGFDIFSQVLLPPASVFAEYPMSFLLRCFEFQADRFAVSLGYGPQIISALILMSKLSKFLPTADPLYSALKYSHPPLAERLDAINDAITALEKKTD